MIGQTSQFYQVSVLPPREPQSQRRQPPPGVAMVSLQMFDP